MIGQAGSTSQGFQPLERGHGPCDGRGVITFDAKWFRASLVLALSATSLAACANDVQMFGDDDDSACGEPPPPSNGLCPPAWSCNDGRWMDTAGACPQPACPAGEPVPGDFCEVNGQTCDYEREDELDCGEGWSAYTVSYQCFDNAWTQRSTYCQPEPECPTAPPVAGTDCTGWDDAYYCAYEIATACGPTWMDASCDWTEGGPIWSTYLYDEPICDEGCSAYGDEAGCGADPSCRWLVPGCETGGPNALTEPGCFPAADCSPGDCPDGTSCQAVTYDPCHNQSCNACAAEGAICL